MSETTDSKSFWEHLEDLRGSLIKILAATLVFSVLAFCFKDLLFKIVLAPKDSTFFMYKVLGGGDFSIHLMNVGLTEQFMIHLKTAFVSLVLSAYVMFLIGVAANYLFIFPLTVRFLGTYQVSEQVSNMLTLQSYMDTLLLMSLIFGIVFEIPILSWLLARFGLLKAEYMTRYRRHAIVAILVIAAIITPTGDAFTLLIVSLPIWLLYELSVVVVRRVEHRQTAKSQQLRANG